MREVREKKKKKNKSKENVVAFFFFNFGAPFTWQGGSFSCPPPVPLAARSSLAARASALGMILAKASMGRFGSSLLL